MKNKWLSAPYLFWMAVFIIIPMVLVFGYAITRTDADGEIYFTMANLQAVIVPDNWRIIWKSVRLAFIATVICFVLGYPVAYILSGKEFNKGGNLLFLFSVPMWMNFLLRTYAWLSLLEKNGIINRVLSFFNLPQLNILYTDYAVLLGMVYNFLPFMILPIYTVLMKIDHSLVEAAQDLGANPLRVFRKVVFPLSIPGIVSGITMVFMPAVTTFIVSNLLGGAQYWLIGNLIERQFLVQYDWHMGSALSMLLMVVIMVSMGIFAAVDRGKEVSQ